MGSVSWHITPIVTTTFGGRHTDRHTHIHTHCTLCKQDQFLETRHVSGLIMLPLMMSAMCVIHPHYIFIFLHKWIITTKGIIITIITLAIVVTSFMMIDNAWLILSYWSKSCAIKFTFYVPRSLYAFVHITYNLCYKAASYIWHL